MSLTDQPLVLDHAVIGALDNLDNAADIYRRLGFSLTPRGYHTLGSINHLAIFGENYLELLGFPAGNEKVRADLWSYPPGLNGLAFRASDSAALHDALGAANKPVDDWKDFSRPVEIDGKQQEASFRTFQLGRDIISNGRFFFCQHNTPELVWRPSDQKHPNGVENITDVFIVSHAAEEIVDLLNSFPEPAIAQHTAEEIRIQAGIVTIHILTEDKARARFGDAIPGAFEGNHRKVALGLKTTSLQATADVLAAGGFTPASFEEGLLVTSADAGGVALLFRA